MRVVLNILHERASGANEWLRKSSQHAKIWLFPRYVAHAYGEGEDERSCVGTVDNQLRLSFLKDLPSICSGLVHVFKLSSVPFEAKAVLKSDEKYLWQGWTSTPEFRYTICHVGWGSSSKITYKFFKIWLRIYPQNISVVISGILLREFGQKIWKTFL